MPVLAPAGPGDCFNTAIEAWRLATKLMTPVMLLSDAFTANGAEPWRIPDMAELEPIAVTHPPATTSEEPFRPYERNDWLARPWALPGTPGLTHRIGGIEKADGSGSISYDPLNHELMVMRRAEKIAKASLLVPPPDLAGPTSGALLVVSWGGTFGACREAVLAARQEEKDVSHLHLRCLNPLPPELGDTLKRFGRVLVPELNCGQLRHLLRAEYLVDAQGLNKVRGEPFWIDDIKRGIDTQLEQGT